jgi:choline dehydrogenase-like flavoprotein
MSETQFDVVVVGAGVAGSIVAKELTRAGKRVLLLEAGVSLDMAWEGYQSSLDTFYTNLSKEPEAPYPNNPNAPQPDVNDIGQPNGTGYFIEIGAQPYGSTYVRRAGGTTLHWLGGCPRMIPEDFHIQTLFSVGRDWPFSYDELERDYALAEMEIGVSADVEDQAYLGVHFPPDYVYPMRKIPQTYSDHFLGGAIDGMDVDVGGKNYQLNVRSSPQGRNSIPNPAYVSPRGQKGYTPVGAVDPAPEGQQYARNLGQRCAGNTNCIPICPIQAKYNALKTLMSADRSRLEIRTKSVASRIHFDPANGRVTSIEYKAYADPQVPEYETKQATATFYVLAAHAIENAKLLLASGAARTSGQVGCNLMDHPVLLKWGLMPVDVGTYRGPISTSGIEDLRGGPFRAHHGSLRGEIGNDGWNWPTGAPNSTVVQAVNQFNLFGGALRAYIANVIPRQFRIAFLVEQLATPTNRVTIDPQWIDALGNYRPVIQYNIDDYTLAGLSVANRICNQMFQRAGIEDWTDPDNGQHTVVEFDGQRFAWGGAGHGCGTHIMGATPRDSVVDSHQRTWDHDNLYAVGGGSMPTIATSNPTLTLAALSFRTARELVRRLQ